MSKQASSASQGAAQGDDPEAQLRAIWAAKGVPVERQDAMIAQVAAAAAPGAWVGPFKVGG